MEEACEKDWDNCSGSYPTDEDSFYWDNYSTWSYQMPETKEVKDFFPSGDKFSEAVSSFSLIRWG